ncbi:ABC transporter permease [Halorussus marinus]|uniref:ABC transporter permease n=1 Tax=Halorussus marinus TaxID=2505976 RepID=UPI001092660D|nr:ABC transporter permease [Halorussus marinus]
MAETKSVEFEESVLKRINRILYRLLSSRKGQLSILLLVPILLGSLFAPVIAPHDPTATGIADQFADPGGETLLGTDKFGRDLFSRVLYGGQASITLGLAATALGLVLGVPIGILSGYLGGKTDEFIMRIMDIFLSIPSLLLALLVVVSLGSGMMNAVLAIGIVFMPRLARITRSSTLSIKNEEYITAAEARGESSLYIAFVEILPSVMPAIIVEASIRVGFGILIGTSLSFLGLGTQPPNPDWGYMVSQARTTMHESIWFVLWPSLALGATILGFNLLGDALRDTLDPEVTSDEH